MNQEWCLDALYKDYDDPEFTRDMEALPEKIRQFQEAAASLGQGEAEEELVGILKAEEEIGLFTQRLGMFLALKSEVNTADEQATMQTSAMEKDMALVKKWIASLSNLKELIDNNAFLKEYEYLLLQRKKDAEHLLSGDVEDVIARLNVSAGWAWGNLQTYLTSGVEVDFRGEKTNLSAIRNMAYSKDGKVRKEAYEAELAAYPKIADSVAFALNNIKSQVNTICKLRGYDSPI